MASALRTWARYASWLLPHGVHVLRQRLQMPAAPPELVRASVLAANKEVLGRHQGERCFVLGNGPSVRGLDLQLLRGNTIISVSNGYLHESYLELKPAYHCVPQISYVRMTEADVVAWFVEMHARIGSAELFLNETEAALVQKHNLFEGRKVRYLALRESFDEWGPRDVIDICRPVPRVESVPVMVLMIAMHMGFKEIVLLGVDHDHFRTGRYLYAFEPEVQKGKDFSVNADGSSTTPLHDEFHSLARLWRQYRVLAQIAVHNGISILNASPSSALDEFPKMSLSEIIGAIR